MGCLLVTQTDHGLPFGVPLKQTKKKYDLSWDDGQDLRRLWALGRLPRRHRRRVPRRVHRCAVERRAEGQAIEAIGPASGAAHRMGAALV